MPTREHTLTARFTMLNMVAASKRGDCSYEEARAACSRYKRMMEARQMEVFGKVKVRPRLADLLR